MEANYFPVKKELEAEQETFGSTLSIHHIKQENEPYQETLFVPADEHLPIPYCAQVKIEYDPQDNHSSDHKHILAVKDEVEEFIETESSHQDHQESYMPSNLGRESIPSSDASKPKILMCTYCSKLFTKSHHLKQHLVTHSNEKPYICVTCNRSFASTGYLTAHQKIHSGKTKKIPCPYCEKTFDKNSNLQNHLRTHTGEKPHVCKVCNRAFSNTSNLSRHKKLHIGDKIYECDHCHKKFYTKESLRVHVKKHSSTRLYNCDQCSHQFSFQSSLRRHNRIVHVDGNIDFHCDYCGKKSRSRYQLLEHIRKHTGERPFKCKVCNQAFPTIRNLIWHRKVHDVKVKVEPKPPVRHYCKLCERSFAFKNSLTKHEKLHSQYIQN